VAVATGPGGQGPNELALSAPADYGTFQRITPAPEPRPEVMSYDDAAFAPAGDRITFTYRTQLGMPFDHLASSALDGSQFQEIDGTGNKEAFAVNPASGALWWVERRNDGVGSIVVQYQNPRMTTGFPLPTDITRVYEMWVTTAGDLVLVGQTTARDADGVYMQRLVVIGGDGRQVAETPPIDQSTRLIAVV
jgi:hypothetical protein